ncbi:MAG: hypothetical protein MUE33_04410 [Cytophagaceae bacterium]|jgi:hypothetical protein|nr:hypothetical protein [Cytophagaceae bacterium]
MKSNFTILSPIIVVLFFFSCKKKNEDPVPIITNNTAPRLVNPNRDTLSASSYDRSISVVVDLSNYFIDDQNDTWSIRSVIAQSDEPTAVINNIDINDKTIVFETINRYNTLSSGRLLITLLDERGATITHTFNIQVKTNNTAPRLISTLNTYYYTPNSSQSIGLNNLFIDDESDTWTVVGATSTSSSITNLSFSNLPSTMPGNTGIIKAISFQTIATSTDPTQAEINVTVRDEFNAETTIAIPIVITSI